MKATILIIISFLLTILALIITVVNGQKSPTIYVAWPSMTCVHIDPGPHTCDNLPDIYDITWVSEQYRK